MGNLQKVVYLTEAQKETLFENGTITVDGVTITYNQDDLYVTPMGSVVNDVQVNGSSIANNGVANIPIGSNNDLGVVKRGPTGYSVNIGSDGVLSVVGADSAAIKNPSSNSNRPVLPVRQHESTFYGLATAAGDTTQKASSNTVGTYTETAKSAISQMLDAPETVSGTTPSIPGMAGVRYICGECATLTITAPASGDMEVIFESGSTPTVLTVPNTVKFPEWFDATALEANRTYDIIITNATYGVVTSWA